MAFDSQDPPKTALFSTCEGALEGFQPANSKNAQVSIDYEEFLEYQRLKKQQQEQVLSNQNQTHLRLVCNQQEQQEYDEFLKVKQLCHEKLKKFENQEPGSAGSLLFNLKSIMNQMSSMYNQMIKSFEQCENLCNEQWTINIDKPNDMNDSNGNKNKIDTISMMKNKIKQFEKMESYIFKVETDLNMYLTSIGKDLTLLNDNLFLCKDNENDIDNNDKSEQKQEETLILETKVGINNNNNNDKEKNIKKKKFTLDNMTNHKWFKQNWENVKCEIIKSNDHDDN